MFPALKGSPAVQSADPTNLIRIVLQGARSVASDAAPTAPAMPAFDWKLSDAQVAAVVTYIRNNWAMRPIGSVLQLRPSAIATRCV